jgi:4-carboxymuconolactone decarboxylase
MRIVAVLALLWAGPGTASGQTASQLTIDSPATGQALGRIDDYLRTESALSPRVKALAPLITAREMNLPYEWNVREDAALKFGLEPGIIDVVRHNRPVNTLVGDDALIIDFGRQLFRNRHVDARTFAALVERQGRRGAFDAIMLLASTAMTGVLQRAIDQQPPPGFNPGRLPAVAGVGTPTGRPGEFTELGSRPPLPRDVNEDSYYRFPLLTRQELDPRGREIFDRVVGADRAATPRGPVGMTFLSPELVEPVQQINDALRKNGVLDTRMAEIVIATTGREMNSQYQWNVHGAAAEQAGAGRAVLDVLRNDGSLSGLDRRDAVAIAFTREIFREGKVRSETFAAAVDLFGRRGTVEIAALIGDYLMVTTVYNALGMRLRSDQEATLPHRMGAPVGAEWR